MKVIWKYPIIPSPFTLELPDGAEILHIDIQVHRPFLWVLVDPSAPKRRYEFRIYGTGQEITLDNLRYIATFQQAGFVWHVFLVTHGN